MSEPLLTRIIAPVELEIRGDGRTVAGIAVPFDTPAEIRDGPGSFVEVFRKGAFEKTIAERGDRVKALAQHDSRSLPLGRVTKLREDSAGLYAELRMSKTRDADEVLELVKDGALDSFSFGFNPVRDRWSPDGSHVERLEVGLREVSLVAFPAYESARVLAVRSARLLFPPLSPSEAKDLILESYNL